VGARRLSRSSAGRHGRVSTCKATEHRDEADCHAGLHRSFVAGNPSRQQLIATLARATGPTAAHRLSPHSRPRHVATDLSRAARQKLDDGLGQHQRPHDVRSQTGRRGGPERCPHQPLQDIAAADRMAGRDRTSTASASSQHCCQGQDVAVLQNVDGIALLAHPRSPTAGRGTIGAPCPSDAASARRRGASPRGRHRASSTSAFTDRRTWNHRNTPPQGRCQGQDEAARPDLDGIAFVASSWTRTAGRGATGTPTAPSSLPRTGRSGPTGPRRRRSRHDGDDLEGAGAKW
jgi:hypothetical protein